MAALCLIALNAFAGAPWRAGGIGPLHIPPPPSLVAPGGTQARAAWFKKLTAAQQRYVRNYCAQEENGYEPLCGGTPLVAVFDGRPVDFTGGWPSERTPWLVRDLNADGKISSDELLGSDTVLPDGRTARDGFEALGALDANHDGVIDARDPDFASLKLWADRNADHQNSPDELTPLTKVIDSLGLTFFDVPRCDGARNCERQRSAMRWHTVDGTTHQGEVVDLWLHHRLPEIARAPKREPGRYLRAASVAKCLVKPLGPR